MFGKLDNGKYSLIPIKADFVVEKLEPGVYNLKIIKQPFGGEQYLFEKNNSYINTSIIKQGVYAEATKHIEEFFSEASSIVHKEMGLLKKSAVFYNGYRGTGKTFLAGQLGQKMATEKGIITIISNNIPNNINIFIDNFRLSNEDCDLVFIIDEFDKLDHDEVEGLIPILDGKDSKNNIYFIFTMNSTGKISNLIKDRVGRVEKIFQFSERDKTVLGVMIKTVIPEKFKDKVNVNKMVEKLLMDSNIDHVTIDHVKLHIRNELFNIINKELTNSNTDKTVVKMLTEKIVEVSAS